MKGDDIAKPRNNFVTRKIKFHYNYSKYYFSAKIYYPTEQCFRNNIFDVESFLLSIYPSRINPDNRLKILSFINIYLFLTRHNTMQETMFSFFSSSGLSYKIETKIWLNVVKTNYRLKELSLCSKLWFSSPCIVPTKCSRP